MARARTIQLPRAAAALAVGGAAVSLYPRRTAFAEAPQREPLPEKKPIYSDLSVLTPTKEPSSPNTSAPPQPPPTSPTPTDRLTTQVRHARVFLHDQSLAAEHSLNKALTWGFAKETSLANTIASLAPAPQTGEQLLPGAIYVLVATMAGSIVSRNRGIFLRATVPAAVGITAGWMLIPVTMRNIADLSWEYETKIPVISETHAMIGGFSREAWRQTKIHAQAVGRWADETTSESRKTVETWVEKGK